MDRAEGRQRMPEDYSICLGSAGWGVWHSPDAGKSWIRHRAPFPLNSRIQALVAHPYRGAYRSRRWRYGLVREPRWRGAVGAHRRQWGSANDLVADHRPG